MSKPDAVAEGDSVATALPLAFLNVVMEPVVGVLSVDTRSELSAVRTWRVAR